MSYLLQDLAGYLIESGIGTALGEDVFLDFLPDQPNNVVVISEYSGLPTTTGVEALDRRVQIRVRNADAEEARLLSWKAFNLLDTPENRIQLASNNRWMMTQALQTPFKVDIDGKERVSYVFNLAVVTYRD